MDKQLVNLECPVNQGSDEILAIQMGDRRPFIPDSELSLFRRNTRSHLDPCPQLLFDISLPLTHPQWKWTGSNDTIDEQAKVADEKPQHKTDVYEGPQHMTPVRHRRPVVDTRELIDFTRGSACWANEGSPCVVENASETGSISWYLTSPTLIDFGDPTSVCSNHGPAEDRAPLPDLPSASASSSTSWDHNRDIISFVVPSRETDTMWENADVTNAEHHTPTPKDDMSTSGLKRSRKSYDILPAAIFIHAGAGFHSIQNEKFHLSVCSEAATKAIRILDAGGSAVDAVEIAIKHLEDHEITNAGFGSNLTIDGTVECDATIVDHLGRSGACGAVPNIKNPISLAKVILETSAKTLTLKRVPPNFLVGEGAKRFGMDHGMNIVTNEELVSRNARDRYQKWRADLDKVTLGSDAGSPLSTSGYGTEAPDERRKSRDVGQDKLKLDLNAKARKGLQRDHTSAIMSGMWNEGQPDSPTSETRSPLAGASNTPLRSGRTLASASPSASPKRVKTSKTVRARKTGISPSVSKDLSTLDGTYFVSPLLETFGDVDNLDSTGTSHFGRSAASDLATLDASYFTAIAADVEDSSAVASRLDFTELSAKPAGSDKDMIVDTIGAIAIDRAGNIAAGSSSGGIGIKHMGRTGPAALVGVGTAVVPCAKGDSEAKTVATVTSGTGEHMATTMAAQKCADRLYQSTRRGKDGLDQNEDDVSAILKSFVEEDFMGHPGVKNQASTSAIGVMAVEVTNTGIYVHWAHNTESFALASMSTNDREPLTVMSRLPEGTAVINVGGRRVHEHGPAFEGDGGW